MQAAHRSHLSVGVSFRLQGVPVFGIITRIQKNCLLDARRISPIEQEIAMKDRLGTWIQALAVCALCAMPAAEGVSGTPAWDMRTSRFKIFSDANSVWITPLSAIFTVR